MALIRCPECGAEISDKVESCPKCGCPASDFERIQQQKSSRHCPYCGAELNGNEEYCPKCNMRLREYTSMPSQSPKKKDKPKFYQRSWFTILMLIIFFPVGLYLMWRYKKFPFPVRVIVSVFFGLIVVSSILNPSPDDDTDGFSEGFEAGYRDAMEETETGDEIEENGDRRLEETSSEIESAEETTESEEMNIDNSLESESQENIDSPLSDEKKEFETGEYLFITNEDLSKYCVNMQGAKVYVVTDVDDMKDNLIQSTLADGFMMSGFDVGDNYSKYKSIIEKGDIVAVLGTVSENIDYSFFGSSVRLIDCKVFAIGEEAESYKKDKTDDGLSQYLVVTEEVANLNDDISEEDYKALCTSLNYEDILRNPDSYQDTYCVLNGTVKQVIEGFLGAYTIYVNDSSGNQWECSYSYKDGESHLLEGDSVTVYGQCSGTTTATTVIGKQVTLPRIKVKYIN